MPRDGSGGGDSEGGSEDWAALTAKESDSEERGGVMGSVGARVCARTGLSV